MDATSTSSGCFGEQNIWRMQVNPETMRGESGERVTTGSELETEFALSLGGTRWPHQPFRTGPNLGFLVQAIVDRSSAQERP
jgi:hypothetical protein